MSTFTRHTLIDIAIGLISLGLGFSVYFLTFGFQVSASSGLASGMDASLYPRLIASILIGLGLILLIKTIFGARALRSESANITPGNGQTGAGLVKLFPLGIGFTIAIPLLGYYISTSIFVVAMLFVFGERRLLMIVVTTILIVTSFYLLFRYGFNIVLPEGCIWRSWT